MIKVVLLLVGLAAPCVAQSPKPVAWEPPTWPQPFERTAFRPIKVPAWVEQTVGAGYTLSGMDTAARSRAVKHGVTLSEMGFVDPFYAYYDSKLLKRRSPHVPMDRLTKDIAEYQKLGIRILGVYPPTLQGEVYEAHPDWRRIATNTKDIPQIDLKKYPHGGMLCLLGPYGDFFVEVLAEILTTFPAVDAFSFDGLHHGGVCYCEHCRKNYKKDTGQEIPNANLNDSAFRRYQHWADRRLEEVVAKAQTRLKGIKPDVALVTWTTNAGRFGHFLSLPRNMSARMNLLFDAPDQEFWLDESNRGNTIVPAFANAYAWSVTNHRVAFSEPYLMSHGNPYGKDSFPAHEIERRMMLALTYGASPSIAVAQPKHLQDDLYRCLDAVQQRKPFLTHKRPEPWAAVLMSDNTKTFYGREAGRVEERYLGSVFGTFRACVEEHLPTTVLNDWNLTASELAKYAVVVLPNAASLDDRQVQALDTYVRNGGGLVASLDCSLCDEFGEPRKNFALAHVLGVDYRGLPRPSTAKADVDVNFAQGLPADYWEKRKSVFDLRVHPDGPLRDAKLTKLLGASPVTFKGPALRVQPHEGSRVLATFQAKDDAKASVEPAIIVREHGRGRVVYFATGLDSANYFYAYPYKRVLLANSIRWAAKNPPPVQIDAPMCVHSTVMRQEKDGHTRLVIHLFNNVNTAGGHAFPTDDVPLREETIPIHNIRITLDKQYAVQRVHWQPENTELKFVDRQVVVPRLDVHGMVIVELAEKPAP